MPLPPRTANTMSDAIALSSPNGRMSKRARAAAIERLGRDLFGDVATRPSNTLPPQPTNAEKLLAHAARLREMAGRGMCVRSFTKEAARAEAEAAALVASPSCRDGAER